MTRLTFVPELYWSLPGPRHFITRIEECAASVRLLWINLPRQCLPGTWEGVQKGLENGHIDEVRTLKIGGGTNIGSEIAVHLGRRHLSAAELMSFQADKRTAFILMPDGLEGVNNIGKFGAEFLNAIGRGNGNIQLVLGGHEEALAADQRDGNVQVITFDGGLSPDEMDAYIAIRMLSRQGPGSTRLARAIVSEFGGFDVELAERIMQLGESQIVNIIPNLPGLMTDGPLRWRYDSWLEGTRSSSAEGATHSLNDVYLAEHGPIEGREGAKSRLKQRYWRACVKTLTPWLEERRLTVIRMFDSHISREAAFNNGKIANPADGRRVRYLDPGELEYNNIVGMCKAGTIVPATTQESCAEYVCRLAKAVRDEIAHMRMPELNDIVRLIREMDRLLIPMPETADN
jgi:hypothetical protein